MDEWKEFPRGKLAALLDENRRAYDEAKRRGLKLDLSRGKPSPDVLDLSNGLLERLDSYYAEDGTDVRNYGVAAGLPECKRLFSDLLGIPADSMIVGGNSSLSHMYQVFSVLYLFGPPGHAPWCKRGKVKILCPCPGYDRHFSVAEDFGAELVAVPMTEDGPDMAAVEKLVIDDESVKGIWCVPLYSNPQGVVYSDETVMRLATMKTAATDFRVFWDNAYGVHHVFEEHKIADIMKLASEAGNAERVCYFFSTSKLNFPGGGVGLFASGPENIAQMSAHISKQTIGYDKIIQLRTVRFFGNAEGIKAHMRKIGDILRPKFELVLAALERDFAGTGLVKWVKPKGGYFVSIDTLDGCAKRVVALAKDAGAVLTGAGATYPYKRDPRDSNIRIAPTYPSLEELRETMALLSLCVRIASAEKLLETARG
ncbi:MAG: aminotransferase class I/II-fold pyridoxal phosphate-dependent enzyme [Clostridiales Family XIII bacterium]|jgi:DNA-binding transcriptional MocR family regulator|nr:aminotransferase class I/II-fold pyridoxal phosphate-dependent enzyme [Clostridiales Family XIII bacterium]